MNRRALLLLILVMGFAGGVRSAEPPPASPSAPETAPAAPVLAPGAATFKGKPRLVRGSPRTEVFFVDLRDSYWIAEDQQHNAFQKAFLEGIRKDKPVGFTADIKTRRVLAVDGVARPVPVNEDEELLDVESQR